MAAPTKTARTLQASTSNAAAASTPASLGTGNVNLGTTLGMLVTTKITNGATGPTIGCTINVYTSHDGTNWKLFASATAGVAVNGVYEFPFQIPAPAMFVAVQFTGNTAQAVTVEAFGQEFTSFA